MRWIIILLGIPTGLALVALSIYLLATGEASITQGLGAAAMGVLFTGAGVNALSPSVVERLGRWHAMRGSRSPFDTPEVDELVGLSSAATLPPPSGSSSATATRRGTTGPTSWRRSPSGASHRPGLTGAQRETERWRIWCAGGC